MKEWLTLMEALELGLHQSTMKGFYNLCMAVLCKSEGDFDRFQQAFLEFFRDQSVYQADGQIRADISDEMLSWLNHPGSLIRQRFTREDVTETQLTLSQEEIERMLEERVRQQKGQHNGGNYWVGTGASPLSATTASIPVASAWAASEPTALPCGWPESAPSGTSALTTYWTSASFKWPSACCANTPSRRVRRRSLT